jgi:hypothetical protein
MPDDVFGGDDFDLGDFGDDAEAKAKRTPEGRKEELSDLLKKLKARAEQEQAVFMENVDSEFWACLCFQTRAQKDEFLRRMNWADLGDKYLDGVAVADRQGMKLEAKTPPVRKRNVSKRWREFV